MRGSHDFFLLVFCIASGFCVDEQADIRWLVPYSIQLDVGRALRSANLVLTTTALALTASEGGVD
jgi:hypothetical protein